MYHAFLDLLFPPTCLACEHVLCAEEQHLCLSCLATLPPAELESPSKKNIFMQKFYGVLPLSHTFSLYYFYKKGRVQQLLHNLKYHQKTDALLFFGNYLGHKLFSKGYATYFDLIIPVPLHPRRAKERGYNQSEYFARGLSQKLDVPLAKEVLKRDVYTFTQTTQSKERRFQNIANAFSLKENLSPILYQKKILLVDDLITTGATITASAETLLTATPYSLSFATLALAG